MTFAGPSQTGNPPNLPLRSSLESPPPYTPYPQANQEAFDPRTSSTQSLLPDHNPEKRRLLLIYIHGFQGDETSFQSFPAHVHNVVKITLSESHTVHTKIYPKYRTRRALEFARDDFSKWLLPHESPDTDVILLGHSMGGLLSAEVVLIPAEMSHASQIFRHRILGTINFDVPFLGMHPGVISSGLGSLFRPADKPDSQSTTNDEDRASAIRRNNTLFRPPTDSGYNPSFSNDVNLPVRKGWEGAMHFFNKHKHQIFKGSRQFVTSHLEFGGAMADYSSLKKRHETLRPLDEEDELKRRAIMNGVKVPPRVRFVNYYTVSTGRPKRPSSSTGDRNSQQLTPTSTLQSNATESNRSTASLSPRISVEEHADEHNMPKQLDLQKDPHDTPKTTAPSIPEELTTQTKSLSLSDNLPDSADTSDVTGLLPPLPPKPEEPPKFNPAMYPDEDIRRFAEKTHAREVKMYHQRLNDWEDALQDREALEKKLRTKSSATKPPQRQSNETPQPVVEDVSSSAASQQTSHDTIESEDGNSVVPSVEHTDSRSTEAVSIQESETSQASSSKPKRDRKFCMLPKDLSCWIPVRMEGVDEVGAHCGLFFLGDTYEQLVGDVAGRIGEWVQEDMTRRFLETSNYH